MRSGGYGCWTRVKTICDSIPTASHEKKCQAKFLFHIASTSSEWYLVDDLSLLHWGTVHGITIGFVSITLSKHRTVTHSNKGALA